MVSNSIFVFYIIESMKGKYFSVNTIEGHKRKTEKDIKTLGLLIVTISWNPLKEISGSPKGPPHTRLWQPLLHAKHLRCKNVKNVKFTF